MNTTRFINRCITYCKYATSAILLLLFTATANANEHICYHKKQATTLHKRDDDARMFLIAVVDSKDEIIGERCQTDLDQITAEFADIADWIDVKMVDPKIIEGDDFSKAAVNDAIDNWLQNQQPTEADIVIFYYSGHGFRYANDASDYPRMWLKTAADKNVETNNLRIKEDVYDRIIKMGAGVNIVLSDCCNNTAAGDNGNFNNATVPARTRETHKREHPRGEDDSDNGDKLFLPGHPLSILATAAGKDELAGGKPDVGGFFTNYLLDALDKSIYDQSIEGSWQNIFNYADKNASYWAKSAACPEAKHNEQGRCIQTAEVNIDGN